MSAIYTTIATTARPARIMMIFCMSDMGASFEVVCDRLMRARIRPDKLGFAHGAIRRRVVLLRRIRGNRPFRLLLGSRNVRRHVASCHIAADRFAAARIIVLRCRQRRFGARARMDDNIVVFVARHGYTGEPGSIKTHGIVLSHHQRLYGTALVQAPSSR